jgi:hypothetical protein
MIIGPKLKNIAGLPSKLKSQTKRSPAAGPALLASHFKCELGIASKSDPAITKRVVSRSFATFLLCCVDGEAIEQEGDNCFGVARCHGSAIPCAIRQPMKSIALARSRSSRFFEQQAGRTFNSSPKLTSFYLRNSSGSLAKFTAMRRASSLVSSPKAKRRCRSSSK